MVLMFSWFFLEFQCQGSHTSITAYSAILQMHTHSILVQSNNEPSETIQKMVSQLIDSPISQKNDHFYQFEQPHINLKMIAYSKSDYLFLVISKKEIASRVYCGFLEEIGNKFISDYVEQAKTLDKKKYGAYLNRRCLAYLANPPDKLTKALAEVDETKKIMTDNLQKACQRKEALEDLTSQTAALAIDAQNFSNDSERLRCQTCLHHWFCCFASCCFCCSSP